MLKKLILGGNQTIQNIEIYGNFEGFPENNRALFGLVIHNDPCGRFEVFFLIFLPEHNEGAKNTRRIIIKRSRKHH